MGRFVFELLVGGEGVTGVSGAGESCMEIVRQRAEVAAIVKKEARNWRCGP